MKRIIVAVFIAAVANAHAGLVASLDDIELWAGTGSNRSALVLDFHDGNARESFVWGFRWSGNATGFDMLTAIDDAWTELSISSPSFIATVSYSEPGTSHSGVSDWLLPPPQPPRSWGYYVAGGQAGILDDNWILLGYSNISGGGNSFPVGWTVSPSGSSDRLLADGSWDALSFGAYDTGDFSHQTPPSSDAYAAIPEPSTVALLMLGALAVTFYAQKRLHSC